MAPQPKSQRGRSRSAAKRRAARENGKRGGRPRRADALAERVLVLFHDLSPGLPDIDPHDLLLILEVMCKDARDRVCFLHQRPDSQGGGYAF